MVEIVRSHDTLGYQLNRQDTFTQPERVFATPNKSKGYTLYRYIFDQGIATSIDGAHRGSTTLGFPSGTEEIGRVTTEQEAHTKLKKYLENKAKATLVR